MPFRRLRQILASTFAPANRPASSAAPSTGVQSLLGRRQVNLNTPELQRFVAGKTILVTGAGGSIGSEICRQIMRFCPARLILLEQAENALFEIDSELRQRWIGAQITPYVADINDSQRISHIFNTEHPQLVFHCAAHKHVPMMERNAGEAIKNNVFGTKVIADAAAQHRADAFVMVSTDKAVNPTSIMGAAKRCAELYIQWLSGRHATRFVAVRFGNVLGSSGSVVPIFRRQIAAGGPVTVTHPDMRRYFMTIPEASQLVMQAGAMGHGGEIFVLDMGQPMRIVDLAREMIQQQGLIPDKDIMIEFTGIRPGEKLYEELACDNEQTLPTAHPKIRVWQLAVATDRQIRNMLNLLADVIDGSRDAVVSALRQIVPEYSGTCTTAPALTAHTLDDPAASASVAPVSAAPAHAHSRPDDQASRLRIVAAESRAA